MLWLTQLLYWLPSAALGGISIASAWGLCDFREFARLWRFRGISLAGALVTLVGVVVLGIMEGILLGVVFSLVLLLRALAFPPDAVPVEPPDGEWRDPAHRPEAVPVPGLLVYRFAAPLFFANCELFRERIEALVAGAAQPVTAVVVDGPSRHWPATCELDGSQEPRLRLPSATCATASCATSSAAPACRTAGMLPGVASPPLFHVKQL